MQKPLLLAALCTLAACTTPLPTADNQQVWVDMGTATGKLVMADRLDNRKLNDGRYFQFPPGSHELIVRFDFEVPSGGGFNNDPTERTCYLTVRYDHFEAGQRYYLEARSVVMTPYARLYNSQRQVLAQERTYHCLW